LSGNFTAGSSYPCLKIAQERERHDEGRQPEIAGFLFREVRREE